MLESLERANIKKMSVENPEKERNFEISEEDWEKTKAYIEKSFNEGKWSNGIEGIYYAHQLGFEGGIEIPFEKLKAGVDVMHRGIITITEIQAFDLAAQMFKNLGLTHDQDYHKHLETFLDTARKNDQWYALLFLYEWRRTLVQPTKEELKKAAQQAKDFSNRFPAEALHMGVLIRENDPDFDIKSLNLDLSKLDEELATQKAANNWSTYLEGIYYLKQSSLDEPKVLDPERPNLMPEQRNF